MALVTLRAVITRLHAVWRVALRLALAGLALDVAGCAGIEALVGPTSSTPDYVARRVIEFYAQDGDLALADTLYPPEDRAEMAATRPLFHQSATRAFRPCRAVNIAEIVEHPGAAADMVTVVIVMQAKCIGAEQSDTVRVILKRSAGKWWFNSLIY